MADLFSTQLPSDGTRRLYQAAVMSDVWRSWADTLAAELDIVLGGVHLADRSAAARTVLDYEQACEQADSLHLLSVPVVAVGKQK